MTFFKEIRIFTIEVQPYISTLKGTSKPILLQQFTNPIRINFIRNHSLILHRFTPLTIDMVVENSGGKVSGGGGSLSKNNQKYTSSRPFNSRGNTYYDSDKRYIVKEDKKLSFKRKKKYFTI